MTRAARSCKLARCRRPLRDAAPCASSRSTSTASARPSARASRAGSRASSRGTSCACRRSRRTHDDVPRALRAPRKSHAAFHPGRAQGLQRRRRSTRKRRRASSTGFGSREFDAEGRYLEAHFGELTVISVYLPSGLERAAPAGVEVPLPRGVPAASARSCASAGREIILCGDWNIAHQRDRSQELAQQPEELRLPAGGARVADARVRRARLRRRVPPRRSRDPTSTRGGRTAARRGRRTSAGASTTRSRRRASPRRRTPRRSTRTGAFPITRR